MEESGDRRRRVEVLDAAKDGDERALSELLARLRPTVEGYLRERLGSSPSTAALAEELTQVVLTRVAESIEDCRAGTDVELRAWVRTIARRVAIDWYRRRRSELDRRRWEELEAVPGELLRVAVVEAARAPDGESSSEVDRALGRLLMAAQSELSEGTQEVLRRRLLFGDTWAEAGRCIGTTAAGAKRRWQRARERLRGEVLERARALPEEMKREVLRRLGEIEDEGIS